MSPTELRTARERARRDAIDLPPRGLSPRSGPDDPVDYYYRPLTARLYRARLALVAGLLGRGPHESLLEVGYGSGVFLPELARRATHLAAVDLHDQGERVGAMLDALGVSADLRRASLFELPFPDRTFDAVVCVSVLEHVEQLDRALGELRRVLRRGGVAVLGFPVRNALTDAFFRAVGYDPRAIHPSSHGDILRAIERTAGLTVERRTHLPRLLPLALSAYAGCRCRSR